MTHESATTRKELPEALPPGERILWQGAPAWASLYRRAFHGRTIAFYFAFLLALRGANAIWDGATAAQAAMAVFWLAIPAVFALGVLALLSFLVVRSTWYTITDRRVIMRIGIVLEITFNFPFQVIDTARLHLYPNGTGDIPLSFMEGEQIAYAHLWPHARPWKLRRSEPMLRCIPDAARVADLLARAMAAKTTGTVVPIRAAASAKYPDTEAPSHIAAHTA